MKGEVERRRRKMIKGDSRTGDGQDDDEEEMIRWTDRNSGVLQGRSRQS